MAWIAHALKILFIHTVVQAWPARSDTARMRQRYQRTGLALTQRSGILLPRMLLAVLLCPIADVIIPLGARAAQSEGGRDLGRNISQVVAQNVAPNVDQNSDLHAIQFHTPDTSSDQPTSSGQRGDLLVVHISTSANKFVNGAELEAPQDRSMLDCQALYERRLALYRKNLNTDAAFFDDPRTQTSMLVGAIWPPALLYLPYAAAERYLDDIARVERTAEINNLAYASSAQDCFLD